MKNFKMLILSFLLLSFFTVLFSCGNGADNETPDDLPTGAYVKQDLADEVYIFDRHRFMNKNENWDFYTKEQQGINGNKMYEEAKKFMMDKIAELKKDVKTLDDSNDFQRQFKAIINEIPDDDGFIAGHLKPVIKGADGLNADQMYSGNNDQFAKYFALFRAQMVDENAQYRLQSSRDYLANRAYNDSLGNWQGETFLPANKELDKIKQEMIDDEIITDKNNINDKKVETALKNSLQVVIDQTGTPLPILVKATNLIFYNEGLYGAFNRTGYQGITSSDTYSINARPCKEEEYRTRSTFNNYVSAYYYNIQNQQTNQMGM